MAACRFLAVLRALRDDGLDMRDPNTGPRCTGGLYMRRIEEWNELWSEPKTRVDRAAPLLALCLAAVIAMLG